MINPCCSKWKEKAETAECAVSDLARENQKLKATNKQLLSALEEMACDYEAQINAEYTEANLIYPSYKRRYAADMETLNKSKAAITNAKQMGDKG